MNDTNVLRHNSVAWDSYVNQANRWTVPVSPDEVQRAAEGELSVLLTTSRPVPRHWFPDLDGLHILCLASGGGQQGPLLAAAGAEVTVLDNSEAQLGQDRFVAERDGVELETVAGDMADLVMFDDACFDLVFHPCSNCFSKVVLPVWQEALRVLRPGGRLMSGLVNPVIFLFDRQLEEQGIYQLKYTMPYSDIESLSEDELLAMEAEHEPFMFAHSFDDLIGGQLRAGFRLIGFYEDDWGGEEPLDKYFKGYMATLAEKPD